MNIIWCKCMLQSMCRLNLINLNSEYFDSLTGVYIIWNGNNISSTVSVGQGNLRDELVERKIDKKVLIYGPDLFVTWAVVPEKSLEGVEAFLYNQLKPIVHNNITCKDLIHVNLPEKMK